MISLTAKQLAMKRFIQGYIEAHDGVSPSFIEIAVGLGTKSKGWVKAAITGLVERGHLQIIPNRARALGVTQQVPLPRAPDGTPLYFIPIAKAL
jgi:SOS-response transcriptional repressor LexA